jgi:hypothetical protein
LYGERATIEFPGTKKSWKNQHTDTCSDILAKQEIYLALHSDKYASGSTFNSGDGKVATWEAKWPQLCQYFGLVGGPTRREESRLPSVRKRARGDVEEVGERAQVKDRYL